MNRNFFFIFLLSVFLLAACVPAQMPADGSGDVTADEMKLATSSENPVDSGVTGKAVKWMDCKDQDATEQFDKLQLLTPGVTTYSNGEFVDKCYTWYAGTPKEKTRLIEGTCKQIRAGERFNYWYADCNTIDPEFACKTSFATKPQESVELSGAACLPSCPKQEQAFLEVTETANAFYDQVKVVQQLINEGRMYTEPVTVEEEKDTLLLDNFYDKVVFNDSVAEEAFEKLESFYIGGEMRTFNNFQKVNGKFIFSFVDIILENKAFSEEEKKIWITKLETDKQEFKRALIYQQIATSLWYNTQYAITDYTPEIASFSNSLIGEKDPAVLSSVITFFKELREYTGSVCNAILVRPEGGWTSGIWKKDNGVWKLTISTAS